MWCVHRREQDHPRGIRGSEYLRLALLAQKVWREESPWSEFFHPAEKVTVGELDSQKRILARMHQLGIDTDASIISVDETKRRYPGILEEMAFHDCQETYLNPDSGWAEATPALAKSHRGSRASWGGTGSSNSITHSV